MAVEIVRVYTVDENSDPLEGVLVKFYDNTDTFVTQDVSALVGADVYAEVMLDGDDPTPIDYTIRMQKLGVAFDGLLGDDSKSPQAISVYSPPGAVPPTSNGFTVQGQTFSRPAATDPRLCRASGHFYDLSGRPLANLDVHFIGTCLNEGQDPYAPTIVDGNAVLQGGRIISRTDSNGYLEIDLYRDGEYAALVQGQETMLRKLLVPDASSVNIVHLLWPVVSSVTFSPDPLNLTVDDYTDVDVTLVASNGQALDLADGDMTFSSEDTGVATVQVVDGKLRVFGVAAGSTQIVGTRSDTSIRTKPEEPQTYSPLIVTVV